MPRVPIWPLEINHTSPHAVGLVGLWNTWSNRAGVVWDDLSGYGNTGTVTYNGDAAYMPVLTPSALGRTLRFAGWSSGLVGYVALARLVTETPFSVAVWFRPESAGVHNLLFWTGTDGYWTGHYLNAGSGATLNAVTVNAASFTWSSGVAYVANQWQHAVGVWQSDSYRRAYLNGVGDTADTTTKTPALFTVSRFGSAFFSSTMGMLGNIAEARIYNRALQPAEIASMYHPASRWSLYQQPRRYYYVPAVVAGRVSIYGARPTVALPGGVRIAPMSEGGVVDG